MNQKELEIWLQGCLTYYNKYSITKINKMKSTEERIEQLEKAHSRLFNQLKEVLQDIETVKNKMGDQSLELSNKIDEIKELLQPKEEVPVLPDEMKNNIDYVGIVSEIIKSKQVKWKEMDYTNWELKLKGKDEYAYIAFIPTEYTLVPGDKVKFTYVHPFQLKKLKQI